MPHSTTTLTADEVDDLIYFSRAGDLGSLKESIEVFSKAHQCSAYTILTAAVDIDDDGLGSGSCLLHYPAANGNLEVVTYLLSIVTETNSGSASAPTQDLNTTSSTTGLPSLTTSLVNHQNVSGNTALHWAGMNGHLEIVKALIRAGADPEVVNAAGRDAVVESEWSSKEGAAECAVWILRECGALEKGVGDGAVEGVQEGEGSQQRHAEDEVGEEENGPIGEAERHTTA